MSNPTVGSLFSGIGGLDLAAHWAGFTTSWFVEKEPFCQKVLAKHWPDVPIHDDIFECHNLSSVDVIVGGFPCQPFSVAGQQRGRDDERFLLPEMLRIVDEVKPYAVLFENVPGFPSLNDGREFKYLLGALAEMGFNAEWGHIRASDIGAPHQRERWFCVAYTEHNGHITAALRGSDETAVHNISQGQDSTGESTRGDSPRIASGEIMEHAKSDRCETRFRDGREQAQITKITNTNTSVGNAEFSGLNWQSRGWTGTQLEDGHTRFRGRQAQPGIRQSFNGFSAELDGYRGVDNAISSENNTRKILFGMRRKVRAQTFQRHSRGFKRFQPQKILRPIVFTQSTQERTSNSGCIPQKSAGIQKDELRTLRHYGEFASPSSGFESNEQQPIQFGDVVRYLSLEMALGEREKALTKESVSLQDLWSATKEITSGNVRKTLPALQEVWRSLPNENKVWIALRACEGRGLTRLFPARPGEPQHAYEPPRTTPSTPTTNARIKALGNAVVPQCAYPIFAALMEWFQEIDNE